MKTDNMAKRRIEWEREVEYLFMQCSLTLNKYINSCEFEYFQYEPLKLKF